MLPIAWTNNFGAGRPRTTPCESFALSSSICAFIYVVLFRKRFEVSETARLLAEVAPDNLASLKGFFSREPQENTAALLQAIAADGPGVSEQDLRNLETPTLIVGHEIDYIHPFSYATALSQLIPGSQLVRITPKGVSKAAYLEDLHKAITNFLETFSDARMLE